MEYRLLGRSGLRVSPVALGTMNFGPETPEEVAHTLLDDALERGINFIDTADVYGADANRTIGGFSENKGLAERIIGRWLAKTPGRREQVVLATKVYGAMGHGPNDQFLSAAHLRRACEASLKRLQTDYIDLYVLHHIDRNTSWDEIWEALAVLRQQGKVLYFGTSNHPAWHIVQGQHKASERGLLGLVAEQSLYSLMERSIELEVLPACREYGIGVLVYSPLNSGLLAGILKKSVTGSRSQSGRAITGLEVHRRKIEKFESFCDGLGEHPAAVAQAWLLHQPGVTAPVIGARTIEHLRTGLHAATLELGASELKELDTIFPGPGGPAPEAYAW